MHTTLFPLPGPTGTSEFAMSFTSTPRGARLARLFVSHCLDSWGHPYDSEVNETLTLVTAELCANAVQHGRVPGRDFHVRLTTEADGGSAFRVEVSDTRAERRPAVTAPTDADAESESGRGLLLVAALADDWGVTDRRSGPGKTVWAVVSTPSSSRSGAHRQAPIGSPCRPAAEPVPTGSTRPEAPHRTSDAPNAASHGRDVGDPA
ncbi:ATP-binding protein [Streptomyces sp. NPDC050388]|uniref:ATP-binding protein n=1 Tax=Streptomyces sp. NPDC050388 TaxID=3155781 RepID=UPI00343F9EB2